LREGSFQTACPSTLYRKSKIQKESWGVRGGFLSHPAQKGQLTTAHIIGLRPRKTKLLPKPGLSLDSV